MKNTVMIVDDKKINIDMLTQILRQDYAIMAAVSGEMALRVMETKKPDLLLLDVYMPGMDGLEVLAHMKEKPELTGIPVIFVTGEHDVYIEEKGLMLGAVDYIKKPYNTAIVGYKVRNQLEFKSYRDHLEMIVMDRTRQLAASHEAIIMGMSLLSESHDKVTGDHIERIKLFTRILCAGIRSAYPELLTPEMMESTILYSPLHDVGKASITDLILKKEGLLTPQEFEIMKMHTVNGADILKKTERFFKESQEREHMEIAVQIAEFHHERYDGTGYPHGLRGDEIPISARIVSLADVYDALRSPRPYKNALTHEQAVQIILNGDSRTTPSHFDPRALAVFEQLNEAFDKAYLQ